MTFGKRIDGLGGRRRAARNSVGFRAEMVTQTKSIDVTFVEMSGTGAKLHGTPMPPAGQSVLVRSGPLEAFGTVIWSERDFCGVHFDLPATLPDLDTGTTKSGTLTALDATRS